MAHADGTTSRADLAPGFHYEACWGKLLKGPDGNVLCFFMSKVTGKLEQTPGIICLCHSLLLVFNLLGERLLEPEELQ